MQIFRGMKMKKLFAILLSFAIFALTLTNSVYACTSFILKAKDGSSVYGRTLEWGIFDFKSNLVMVPRNLSNTANLGANKQGGITWKNKYGFVAINTLGLPYYVDGMNETGLTVGVLYLPEFAEFQSFKAGAESSTLSNVELIGYILGQFSTIEEIKTALPKLRVIDNLVVAKAFGAPVTLHFTVTDSVGNSIVIEYVKRKLNIYDNKIGIMTNSPPYYWHLENLRNYTHLTPYDSSPYNIKIDDINFTPFDKGQPGMIGLLGLPGDYSPTSDFIRAFFFTRTSVPLENADAAINQASRILNNFDIPKGMVREGTPDKYDLNYTQWSVIGDLKNKHYYWWTEWNRQMRMVDLTKINFTGNTTIAIPLDKIRKQNIDNRTNDFLK